MKLITLFVFLISFGASAPVLADSLTTSKQNGYSLDASIFWQDDACLEGNTLQVSATAFTSKSSLGKKIKGQYSANIAGTLFTDCNATAATRITVSAAVDQAPSVVFQGLTNASVSLAGETFLIKVSCPVKTQPFDGGIFSYYECPRFGEERTVNISAKVFAETLEGAYTTRKTEFFQGPRYVTKFTTKNQCQDGTTATFDQILLENAPLVITNGFSSATICQVKDSKSFRYFFD